MEILEYVLVVIGILGLVVGYRKNSRNVLLTAAIVLSLGCGVADFAKGFHDGYERTNVRKL